MTCTEFERLLDQREPDAQTEAALQRHAKECAHCRMLMELRTLDRDEQVPEEVSTRWKAALRTEQAKAGSTRRAHGFFQVRVLAPLCAVAAVLVAAVALRNPITDVKDAKSNMLNMPTIEAASSKDSETDAPDMPEAEPENGAMVKAAAKSTAMPTLRATAAATPGAVPARGMAQDNSLARETEPQLEEAVPEEVIDFESDFNEGILDGDASWAIPMEEAIPEDYETSMLLEASDSAAMTREEAEPMVLSWTAEHPREAVERILSALGRTGETAELTEDDTVDTESAVFALTVRSDEWPAFLAALTEAGYGDTATLEEKTFGVSDSVELILSIKTKEN